MLQSQFNIITIEDILRTLEFLKFSCVTAAEQYLEQAPMRQLLNQTRFSTQGVYRHVELVFVQSE
jgi:hypothetical protein